MLASIFRANKHIFQRVIPGRGECEVEAFFNNRMFINNECLVRFVQHSPELVDLSGVITLLVFAGTFCRYEIRKLFSVFSLWPLRKLGCARPMNSMTSLRAFFYLFLFLFFIYKQYNIIFCDYTYYYIYFWNELILSCQSLWFRVAPIPAYFLILLGVSLTHVVLYRTVYYVHTFTYYNFMFITVL